jgi:hypothetical protein
MKFEKLNPVCGVLTINLSDMLAEHDKLRTSGYMHVYICFMMAEYASLQFKRSDGGIPKSDCVDDDKIMVQFREQWFSKVLNRICERETMETMESWNNQTIYSVDAWRYEVGAEHINSILSKLGATYYRRAYRKWVLNKAIAQHGDLEFRINVEVFTQDQQYYI